MKSEEKKHPSTEFGFSKTKFLCPKCAWIGLGEETEDIGMSELSLYDAGCPNCGSMWSLGAVLWDSELREYRFYPYHAI
jgi:hypothetical protein